MAAFTHAPCVGIKRIADRLAALIADIPRGTRITVVGHSLGGVVARWYVQEMNGHRRVAGPETAMLGFGEVVVVPDRGHNAVLFDPEVEAVIIDRVRRRARE